MPDLSLRDALALCPIVAILRGVLPDEVADVAAAARALVVAAQEARG